MMVVAFMFDVTATTTSFQTMQELFYHESLERFSTCIAIKNRRMREIFVSDV